MASSYRSPLNPLNSHRIASRENPSKVLIRNRLPSPEGLAKTMNISDHNYRSSDRQRDSQKSEISVLTRHVSRAT